MTTIPFISKIEVHDIEITLVAYDSQVSIENLEKYLSELKSYGFTKDNRINIFGALTNQKARLEAKRSMLDDGKDANLERLG